MAADLAQDQKRLLLAQMAQTGSAATAAYQQGQTDIAEQRKAALAASIGESAKAGGVNDVGGLLDRRVASIEQGKQSRAGDIAQRTQAYSGDLDMAAAGNRSRVTEIDGNVATRRQELERTIASKRADEQGRLALMRMEADYKRRAIAEERAAALAEREEQNRLGREEMAAKANSPESMASRLRALRYLENPDGEEDKPGKPTAAQARMDRYIRAAGINAEGRDPQRLLDEVRGSPSYAQADAFARETAAAGRSAGDLRALLAGAGINRTVAELITAEFSDQQTSPYRRGTAQAP